MLHAGLSKEMQLLYLQDNMFSGNLETLAASVAEMNELFILDVSKNRFTGRFSFSEGVILYAPHEYQPSFVRNRHNTSNPIRA